MTRHRLSLLGLLALVFCVGGLLMAQDAKKETPAPKLRGQLPANYSRLGLSEEQKQKIYKVQNDFDLKVADLEAQLKKLKLEEKTEIEKVLTDAQKLRLKEILSEKVPGTVEKPEKSAEIKPAGK